METLIVGCGDLGTRLGQLLIAKGHSVTAVRRNANKLPDEFSNVSLNISESDDWHNLDAEPDFVFFTAAAPARTEAAYQATYVESIKNLLSWLKIRRLEPSRIFFSSSTAVYGQTEGEWVNEDSETKPNAFNGQIMLEAEQLLFQSPHPTTVVRFSGLYGPGRTYLINKINKGELSYQEEPPYFTNRIEVTDASRVFAHLSELNLLEDCYLATDNAPVTEKEVYTWLAEAFEQPKPNKTNRGAAQNKRCSNQRLLNTGFQFNYPSFREGYQALIRENYNGN